MKQSITLTLGIYWEKRLTAAQRRFTRACEASRECAGYLAGFQLDDHVRKLRASGTAFPVPMPQDWLEAWRRAIGN